ncbi:cysteine-rich receptor-like protein kinase 26 [Vigna umbellata]|uniref:cysteine-rich receptor-like protein kinase 26 n=1 Tax=Vigna umbellata TaxID=87088 RepID=UPI001F5F3F81|nr:cysteine-rich receptor-like protein kinase 26 [Vigna umbellata]
MRQNGFRRSGKAFVKQSRQSLSGGFHAFLRRPEDPRRPKHCRQADFPSLPPVPTLHHHCRLLALRRWHRHARLHQRQPPSYHRTTGFHRASVDDIDDRFLCRGDVNATVCHGCVVAATTNITRLCPNDTESYIWYDECTLIYSNSTFNNDDIVPGITLNDEGSTVNSNKDHFNQLLSNLLNSLEGKALESSMGEKKFAAGAVSVTTAQTLYGMAAAWQR